MATNPTAMPEGQAQPQAAISPFGRVIGVIFSPKATFEDIARKPSWVLVILIWTALSVISVVALNQRMNWRDYIIQQMEKSPRAAQLSAEQKQQQADMGVKFTVPIVYASGFLVPICFALFVGLVMWGAYNLLAGAGARFSQSFSIVAHAGLVGLGIVGTPLFLLVLFLRSPGTVDPDNPVATNLAVLLPEDSAKWLLTLCKSIDVFSLWTLILIAIGFAAVNPRKLKGAKSFTLALTVWAVYVVLRVGWAFITS